MTTRLVVCSTLFQLIAAVATKEAGGFGGDRAVLVVANTAHAPELVPSLLRSPGANRLVAEFDDVVELNPWIAPQHPREWVVHPHDGPMYERLFRTAWNLGDDDLELVVESLPNAPGGALAYALPSARISMHSDGLMSYGPLRRALPRNIAERLQSVYYVDLVPGLRPVRLEECEPAYESLPARALRPVFAQLASATDQLSTVATALAGRSRAALLLGQYLSVIGLLSPQEEAALHEDMVDRSLELGVTNIVFKPHPSAPPAAIGRLRAHAESRGASFTAITEPVSAETLFDVIDPAVVISCFSTALTTASAVYGIPIASVGTADVLKRLPSYQNSNRIPLAIIDSITTQEIAPPAQAGPVPVTRDLQAILEALAYTLQPKLLDYRRDDAQQFLAQAAGGPLMDYFTQGRLRRLGLPGSGEARTGAPLVQALAAPAKILLSNSNRKRLRKAISAVRR